MKRSSLLAFILPEYCRSCNCLLGPHSEILCPPCQLAFTYYPHAQQLDNAVFKTFWGRVPLQWATCLLRMPDKGITQSLIHAIKYRADHKLAHYLGRELARLWSRCPHAPQVDLVVPMPLHRKRQKERGYNQCARIAEGVADILDVPFGIEAVQRTVHRSSQTGKSRQQRWKDLQGAFHCPQPEQLKGKHLLLLDDVITTGASMESLATALMEIPNIRLSACAVAFVD